MKRTNLFLALCFSICFFIPSLRSQDNNKHIGLLLEYGFVGHQLSDNVNYKPLILGGVYSFKLADLNKNYSLHFDFVPMIGIVFNDVKNYEFGLNGRLSIERKISELSSIFFKIGSGPYWIDIESTRQINGFIFSDYFILGLKKKYHSKMLEMYISYRHLSNLNFKKPNGGINNGIAGVILYF